jgi:hypothetical protein
MCGLYMRKYGNYFPFTESGGDLFFLEVLGPETYISVIKCEAFSITPEVIKNYIIMDLL